MAKRDEHVSLQERSEACNAQIEAIMEETSEKETEKEALKSELAQLKRKLKQVEKAEMDGDKEEMDLKNELKKLNQKQTTRHAAGGTSTGNTGNAGLSEEQPRSGKRSSEAKTCQTVLIRSYRPGMEPPSPSPPPPRSRRMGGRHPW